MAMRAARLVVLFGVLISVCTAASSAQTTYPLSLAAGWNLAGNSLAAELDVSTVFGAQAAVETVWQWDAVRARWALYAPSLERAGTLAAYAKNNSYGLLATIGPGEAYWVRTTAPVSLGVQTGTGYALSAGDLVAGWNIAATADDVAPASFTANIPGVASLWAWDSAGSAWYFYAPSLAASGTLANYVQTKGYKDFGALTLGRGRGFWINRAAAAVSVPTLTLPAGSITASGLAVIVANGDALSESIAAYYQKARGIPAANIIRVTLPRSADVISDTEFAVLKAAIDAQLPASVQATLLTWAAPSRVTGACTMSITSAMALGYDTKYCANVCASTAVSPYYDAESVQPWQDLAMRPSMMLGSRSLAAATALIDRGVLADGTRPTGDGYLLRTSDVARNVRYRDYASLPSLWSPSDASGGTGLQLHYIDNSAGAASDSVTGKTNVLFYFTGLTTVPGIAGNSYRPGAIADHLTSSGGVLPDGGGQMPITSWLDAGVTASYGTVAEPCNYTQKFSKASVLIDHYYRGATLIEAYWKSVQWPGQGLFVGEPLAQPFSDNPVFTVANGQYLISTRALRANRDYALDYRTSTTAAWVNLASFSVSRATPQVLRAPLAPSVATQLRWVGPCPTDSTQQCTLSTSN